MTSTDLPKTDGFDFDARYLPGVETMDIGGNWYDVISTGPSRFLFVVGDISGRGLRAAIVMASLR
jgi:serine phosphatase RsbU (regulator of sigma subunit)